MYLGLGNMVPGLKGQFGVSADFSYPVTSWCKDDGNKTPTVSGTEGGVFTFAPTDGSSNVLVWENPASPSTTSDDGIINTTASPAGSYEITYTVEGLSNSVEITITADVSTTFTYPNGENRFTILPTKADPSISGDFAITTNPGNLSINTTTGAIDLSTATAGQTYTVTFTPTGTPCGNPTTASFTVVQAFQSFEFTIQVNAGDTFTIPTTGSGYSYSVNWGTNSNNNITNFVGQGNAFGAQGYTGNATSPTYTNGGTYTIQIGILGDTFPRIYFNNGGDKAKMRNITSWGEIPWTSFDKAFYGCSNLDVVASDTPDLTNCNNFNDMFHRCFPSLTGTTAGTNWNWTFNNNASNFGEMFRRAGNFNGDISNWNTSKVTDMNFMFAMDNQGTQHQFNQNIGSWDVGEVTNMSSMFNNSIFNQNISNWDTSKVTNMAYMFSSNGSFNQDINTKDYPTGNRLAWDVSSCTNFASMFGGCTSFSFSVDKWKIYTSSNNVNMSNMFTSCGNFNNSLNTSQVTVGQGSYQQTYLAWDMQKVNNLSNFAKNSGISGSLSNWDTSSVTNIQELFKDTSYNQPLVNQQVTVGAGATARTYNAWDVSNITNMFRVFRDNNAFNQDLSSWDINTSGNVNMSQMFYSADSFDQDLSNWTVTNVNNFSQFLSGVALSTTNYDAILTAWDTQGAMAYSGTVDFGNSVPSCDNAASNGAFAARASLITKWGGISDKFSQNNTCKPLAGFDYTSNAYCANGSDVTPTITGTVDQTLPLGGTISDTWSGAVYVSPFQMTFEVPSNTQRTITINRVKGTSFTVDWGDGYTETSTGSNYRNISHTYNDNNNNAVTNPTVSIGAHGDTGAFTAFRNANSNGDDIENYLLDIPQWGDIQWDTMLKTFRNATNSNFNISATDAPNFSNLTSLQEMFANAEMGNISTSGNLANWDLSNITSITYFATGSANFNPDITAWNTQSINNALAPFGSSFNRNLSNWPLSSTLANNATGLQSIFASTSMSTENYTDTIVGWALTVYKQSGPYNVKMIIQTGRTFDCSRTSDSASGQTYEAKYGSDWIDAGWTNAGDARDYLTGTTANWDITNDSTQNC